MANQRGDSNFLKTPPAMSDDMSYQEWKTEIELWSEITELPKKKHGGSLFFTLKGDARDTIRAKLTKDEIASDKGFAQIIETLDKLYLKDAHQAGFTAYEQFIQYRRPPGTSIKDYIIQFNLKYSKIKTYKMTLPDGVLAYNLLICANLTEDQQQLCRATVSDMTYDEMRKTIEKVAVSCSSSTPPSNSATNNPERFHPLYNESRDHTDESYFTSYEPDNHYQEHYAQYEEEEDVCEQEDTFFTNNQFNKRPNFSQMPKPYQTQPKLNPPDEFGKPSTCSFCHSIYHWIDNCPHAPPSAKFTRGKPQRRGFSRGGRQSWRPRSQPFKRL